MDLSQLGEITPEQARAAFGAFAKPAGQAVKDYKPLEWTIQGLLPVGSFLILAGPPKTSCKSLLGLLACKAVASGVPFLGLPTLQGESIFANFEDGYDCCVDRLRGIGIESGDQMPFQLMAEPNGLQPTLNYVRLCKPRLLYLDPLIEVARLLDVENENNSMQIGAFMAQIRNVARAAGTSIVLNHHFSKNRDSMRGSGALEGAVDGWINVLPTKKEGIKLQWTLRRGPYGMMRIDVTVDADQYFATVLAKPTFGKEAMEEDPAGGGGRSGRPKTEDAVLQARQKITALLLSSPDPLSRDDIRDQTGLKATTVGKILDEMIDDGVVGKGPKGRRFVWAGDRPGGKAMTLDEIAAQADELSGKSKSTGTGAGEGEDESEDEADPTTEYDTPEDEEEAA